MDRLIKNARIVTKSGVISGNIGIDNGKIISIGTETPHTAQDVIDATGKVAMPGAIDVHTHMHDPDLFTSDITFTSETASAVAGGVTTVMELPTQSPITTPEAMQEKIAACSSKTHVDFKLVAGNFQSRNVDISRLQDCGVTDFKIFTSEPYQADNETIIEIMHSVAGSGGKVWAHCETQAILDYAKRQVSSNDPEAYPDSRPIEAEVDAITRIGEFARITECPVHIVHITSGRGATVARQYKRHHNAQITLETCPQYLAFSKADVEKKGPFLKVNPGLRTEKQRKLLWNAVTDGTIDLIATDHFPVMREDRKEGWNNIWDSYAGVPGVETMVEYLISRGVHMNRISWQRLAELICENPAREAGIYPQKGSLAIGSDADIMLIDETTYEVSADEYTFSGGWTPFEGQEWSARVDLVLLNGDICAQRHTVLNEPGDGSYLQ